MKKIITSIFLSVMTLSTVTSCRDAIDIVQDGEMSTEATFQTVADVNTYLIGSVYSGLDNGNEVAFTSRFTDEVAQGNFNTELSFGTHQYFIDRENTYATGMWSTNNWLINRVNRLLKGIEVLNVSGADQAKLNSYIAEARAIRAYANARMIWYFSPDPKDDNALGGILFNDVPAMNNKSPRNTNGEIYASIFEDLKFAEQNIVDRTGTSSVFYINKHAINAIYAHVYLNKGDFANARLYAQKVIDQSGKTLTKSDKLPIGTIGSSDWHKNLNAYTSTNDYIKMWNDASVLDSEIIFGLSRPALVGTGTSLSTLFQTNQSNLTNGNIQYDMSRSLFNILEGRKVDDIRRWAYIDPTSKILADYATNPKYLEDEVLVIDKYPGKYTNNAPMRNDAKIFRLSDMYLIVAEAAAYAGDLATAAKNVKAVRDARSMTGDSGELTYANSTDALKGVLAERRIELAFEGHRYLDLKRSGKAAGVAIDRDATDDKFDTPLTLPIDDYRMRALPIPKTEQQGNPNIQQNPGYND